MIESKKHSLSGAEFSPFSNTGSVRKQASKPAAWETWWNRLVHMEQQMSSSRWLFLVVFVLLILLAIDVGEHYQNIAKLTPSFLLNVIVLVAVMVLGGLSIQIRLSGIIDQQSDRIESLNQRNELIQQLSSIWNVEEIGDWLLEYIHRFVPQAELSFSVFNRETNRFETTAVHAPADGEAARSAPAQPSDHCRNCMRLRSPETHSLERCSRLNSHHDESRTVEYCLPITYRSAPALMVRVGLKPDQSLTRKQITGLQDAASITASRLESLWRWQGDLNDLLLKAKVSERRSVARDLHDTVCQDLCYASLKLDQMTENLEYTPTENLLKDLRVMRTLINTDYESIRGTLASLYPDTASRLGKLLSDHASLVADRSGIHFEIIHQGEPRDLNPESIRQIYYVCREAINNVEKHAHASTVWFSIDWEDQQLSISIVDDGQGFDVEAAKPGDHFGLKIMRERIESLDGKITVSSSNLGTRVELKTPYEGMLTAEATKFGSKPLAAMDLKQ